MMLRSNKEEYIRERQERKERKEAEKKADEERESRSRRERRGGRNKRKDRIGGKEREREREIKMEKKRRRMQWEGRMKNRKLPTLISFNSRFCKLCIGSMKPCLTLSSSVYLMSASCRNDSPASVSDCPANTEYKEFKPSC